MTEAAVSNSPHQWRHLFAIILHVRGLSNVMEMLLRKITEIRCQRMSCTGSNEDHEQSEHVCNDTLTMVENQIMKFGAGSVTSFGLPAPSRTGQDDLSLELQRESHYNIEQLQRYVEEDEITLDVEQLQVHEGVFQSSKVVKNNDVSRMLLAVREKRF